MAQVFTDKSTKTQYFCRDCDDWVEGLIDEVDMIKISYDGPLEDFDIDNYSTWTEYHCAECGPVEEGNWEQKFVGDPIYECGKCDQVYPTYEEAEECCT